MKKNVNSRFFMSSLLLISSLNLCSGSKLEQKLDELSLNTESNHKILPVVVGTDTANGPRRQNFDRFYPNPKTNLRFHKSFDFFGIYDGHGEHGDAADLLNKKLHYQLYTHPLFETNTEQAIKDSLQAIHKEYIALNGENGATAGIIFIRGKKIYAANVGDVSSVACITLGNTTFHSSLSQPHTVDTPAETKRIEDNFPPDSCYKIYATSPRNTPNGTPTMRRRSGSLSPRQENDIHVAIKRLSKSAGSLTAGAVRRNSLPINANSSRATNLTRQPSYISENKNKLTKFPRVELTQINSKNSSHKAPLEHPDLPDATIRRMTKRGIEKVRLQSYYLVHSDLKTGRDKLTNQSRSIGFPQFEPYLIQEPHIQTLDINPALSFIILGSKGLWHVMDEAVARRIVKEYFQAMQRQTAQIHITPEMAHGAASTILNVLRKNNLLIDNTTVSIIAFNHFD